MLISLRSAIRRHRARLAQAGRHALVADVPPVPVVPAMVDRMRRGVDRRSAFGGRVGMGRVTRGRRVGVRSLGDQIRPIHSGILVRRSEKLRPAAQAFIDFLAPARKPPSASERGA